MELEGSGIGLGGVGVSGRGVGCRLSGVGPHLDREAYLLSELRPELVRCGGKPGRASVNLETTLDEVVQVEVSDAGDTAVTDCLRESVWSLMLPPGFDQQNDSFYVTL
jgi:hypothetical protein